MPVTQIFTSSGTWTVPATVYSVQVECIGSGGDGGSVVDYTTSYSANGGGGAGGAYAKKTIQVSPQQVFTVTVGNSTQKDSWFNTATTVIAKGGANGEGGFNPNGNIGDFTGTGGLGTVTGSIGDVVYRGGNGGTAIFTTSGAGGGGAGTNGAGGNASGSVRGIGTSLYGGNGASGTSGAGISGNLYGGGGSGARTFGNTYVAGGVGGNGVVVLTYEAPGLNRSFIFY